MASPSSSTFSLPIAPHQQEKHGSATASDFGDGVSGSSEKDRCQQQPDAQPSDASITYEYLTFETNISLPTIPTRSNNDDGDSSETSLSTPPNLVHFTSPFQWSETRKTFILILSCCITMLAAYSAGAYSMPSAALREKWSLSSVAFNTGITTWAVGFAISPMVLAPFSEINGRRPVFIASGILFVIAQLGCAVTNSFAGMLVARFFVGAGASTFATMVGGVVSDIYHSHERNTPMAIYSGSALMGTGLGPLISGFIAAKTSWRWVFYVQVIVDAVFVAAVMAFFKETRGSVLLSRKAAALNKYFDKLEKAGCALPVQIESPSTSTGVAEKHEEMQPSSPANSPPAPGPQTSIRYKVAADENRSSVGALLYFSLTTPFQLLFTEPVVFFFSLWAAFAWAVLYMTFDVIALVFSSQHSFTISQIGSVFAAISIGSILGTILSIYQEKIAKRHWRKLSSTPEGRLYFSCVESILLSLGLFWFGWTAYPSIPPIVPIIALGCAQIGIFSIYLAVFNYLADVYHRYASSALAAQSFCRNILAAVFPLFTEAMFHKLGIPGASSLLGGVSALLTIVPWVLVFYGPRIRARSRIASEIMVSSG